MQAPYATGRKVYRNSNWSQFAFDQGLNMRGTITGVDVIGDFVDYEVTWSNGEVEWMDRSEFSVPTA